MMIIFPPLTPSVGPPERPVNCSVVNQTTESLVVECLPGFDGGLDQLFHMEVTDLQTGQRIANTSQGGRAAPEFEVSGLNSGRCGYNGGTLRFEVDFGSDFI